MACRRDRQVRCEPFRKAEPSVGKGAHHTAEDDGRSSLYILQRVGRWTTTAKYLQLASGPRPLWIQALGENAMQLLQSVWSSCDESQR